MAGPATVGGAVAGFAVRRGVRPGGARGPEVAWNAQSERGLVVWEQDTPGAPGTFEIWGRLFDRTYVFQGSSFRISTMGTNDNDPAFDAGMPDEI